MRDPYISKSIVRKYCNKCKYHHPDDEACPQAGKRVDSEKELAIKTAEIF